MEAMAQKLDAARARAALEAGQQVTEQHPKFDVTRTAVGQGILPTGIRI
jgi:hypothetical protein